MQQSSIARQILLSLSCFLIIATANAQGGAPLAITFNVQSFPGGYNISCHGLHDGDIDATIVGGASPYTYSWSNGATTQDIHSLTAGMYTLIVTDALGHKDTNAVTLYEADLLTITLTPSLSNGYNISAAGGNDGTIDLDISGGAPPYTYAWSNGDSIEDISSLTAGTYSVVTTDQNGCTATASKTMIQPSPLSYTITSHKDVKCHGGSDGEIKLAVSGGVSPYALQWSNGSFTKNQLNIPAGTYVGIISDANKVAHDTVIITITEPAALTSTLTPFIFGNGYNIECVDCSNGSITNTVAGGTAPYSYAWQSGETTAGLSGLAEGLYSVTVTDANSCHAYTGTTLTAPYNAWDKNGNTGDSTKFIGTVNAAPLILKTNGAERMRILPDGKVGIGTNNPLEKLEVNGNLKATGHLLFGSDKPISYTPAFGPSGPIIAWGGTAVPIMPECFPSGVSAIAKNQFTGLIELFDNAATPSSELVMGWDGANGIIDLSSTSSGAALFINHYCGKNVYINTGTNAGDIGMCTPSMGKVGIGTSAPTQKLDVTNGFAHFTYNTQTPPANDANGGLTIGWNASNGGGEVNLYNVYNDDPANTFAFRFSQIMGDNSSKNLLTIRSNGNVGIGTDLTGSTYDNSYKLAVKGKIRAEDIMVETGWSDFVFDGNYVRMNILEKEAFYKKEKHLPNIDTGKTIEEKGLQVGKTMNGMMQNIEENTLDMVELYKKIMTIEQENKDLKERLAKLENKK